MSKMMIKHCQTVWKRHLQLDVVDAIQEYSDGQQLLIKREILRSPDSIVVLLYREDNHHLILTSQWRAPVVACGDNYPVIEACAGNIDSTDYDKKSKIGIEAARKAVYREVAEETGWHIRNLHYLYSLYSSPGVSTEKLYYFVASVDYKLSEGGGLRKEGEDIHIIEMELSLALQAIKENKIIDLKTVLLLHYFQMNQNHFLNKDI